MAASGKIPLIELRNIGPASAGWLAACGIRTAADLRAVGALAAYRRVKRREKRACLMLLYALEAAMRDVNVNALSAADKRELKLRAVYDG